MFCQAELHSLWFSPQLCHIVFSFDKMFYDALCLLKIYALQFVYTLPRIDQNKTVRYEQNKYFIRHDGKGSSCMNRKVRNFLIMQERIENLHSCFNDGIAGIKL